MEHQKTRIWVMVEDYSEIDFKKKEFLYCVNSSIVAYISNTREPDVRDVSLVDGHRGITLAYRLENSKIMPFLHRYGLPSTSQWWRYPNESHQFQHELDEWQRQHGIGIHRPQYIYFILNELRNTIKIGISKDPESRTRYLQTSCADPLTYLGSILGNREDERKLHAQFSSCQLAGEWFEYSEDLQDAIENILNL